MIYPLVNLSRWHSIDSGQKKVVGSLFIAFSVFVLFVLGGCSALRTYEVSDNFSKQHIQRVGLLVTRVGNLTAGSPAPITLQTDYSRRTPKPQSTFGISPDSVDVYIEDDDRIAESIPTYPKYGSAPLQNIGAIRKETIEYFRNITPELYAGISKVFREKGYQVINVRELSKSWDKPLSEMTIEQILDHTAPSVDALAVFHYMDTANSDFYAITVKAKTNGLAWIDFTLAVFDSKTKEKLLFFSPSTCNVQTAIAHDQNILSDPKYKDRISVEEHEGYNKQYSLALSHRLTEAELVDIAVKYICHGVSWKTDDGTKLEFRGLDTAIP
jgi:hypothetical protein